LNSSAMTLLRSSLSWSARKSYKHSWNLITFIYTINNFLQNLFCNR
jgi:hypothetical protein